MWCCYNLQYLDKTLSKQATNVRVWNSNLPSLVNYAAVMGLYQDTHINTDQFALLALVFYVTYLAFEIPTGYLMQRLPTAKYLGLNGSLACQS